LALFLLDSVIEGMSKKLCECGICKRCKHREYINRYNANHPEKLKKIRNRSDAKRRARPDWKEYKHAEYEAHAESYKARAKKQQDANRAANNEYVTNYLREHPCVDCGEADIVILDFDHVRGKKLAAVNRLMNRLSKYVIAEIEKCDVRCSNCHRRKTARERNYHRHAASA
jgi:hypothetical protein